MINTNKTLSEINEEAIFLLSKKIGLANTFRFLNQFSQGTNNYTEDRRELYKNKSLKQIVNDIKKSQKKSR